MVCFMDKMLDNGFFIQGQESTRWGLLCLEDKLKTQISLKAGESLIYMLKTQGINYIVLDQEILL